MVQFKFIRRLLKGDWYLNRYWWDAGLSSCYHWERIKYDTNGGPKYTVDTERY